LPRTHGEAKGDLINAGEVVAGELVEYRAPLVEHIPEHAYSGEHILQLHRSRNALRVAPPVRPGSFRHPRLVRS
jgi:hypothetical protein